jgi:Ni/Co efflux regulator RcnB
MRRIFAIAAMFVLAAPTMATAQAPADGRGHPPPRAAYHGPVVHGPVVHGPVVHGPVHVGGPYVFHGHPYAWHPVHFPHPWVYPTGYAYRLWAVGATLPPLFWSTPTYYYTGWDAMGLPPPDPGFQYIEYGPDLLLVNVATGQIVQVFPGAFS